MAEDSALIAAVSIRLFFAVPFALADARRKSLQTVLMTSDLHTSNTVGLDDGGGGGGASHRIAMMDSSVVGRGDDLPLEAMMHLDASGGGGGGGGGRMGGGKVTMAVGGSVTGAPSAKIGADGGVTSAELGVAPWAECLFYTIFWGLKGVEVDAWYQLQGLVWGSDSSPGTIIGKVLTDQFVYNPPWATPSVLAAYMWKDCNFSLARWWPKVYCRHFWLWMVPECLISMWMIWLPACSMIYILPSALQVPLFNIVLCFWSLVLTLLTAK